MVNRSLILDQLGMKPRLLGCSHCPRWERAISNQLFAALAAAQRVARWVRVAIAFDLPSLIEVNLLEASGARQFVLSRPYR